jgi:hypothetical protein
MPTKQRSRCHQQHAPRGARQIARCGRQQRPISRGKLRPRGLPAQDLELVAQHQQLNVFHIQTATATHKRTEQSPHGEIEEGEGHAADPPSPRARKGRHQYWRPSGFAGGWMFFVVLVSFDRRADRKQQAGADEQQHKRCPQARQLRPHLEPPWL